MITLTIEEVGLVAGVLQEQVGEAEEAFLDGWPVPDDNTPELMDLKERIDGYLAGRRD